jgi:DNA replication protein DnaC
MDTQATLDLLKQLRLHGMVRTYEGLLTMPKQDQPTAWHLIARLADAEAQYRAEQKTEMNMRLSKLRYNAVLEQVHCNATRNLTKDTLLSLSDCSFIPRAENILITGATGCGKSYLACAIGRQACIMGYKVLYFGMNRFLEKIAMSKVDGSFIKILNQFDKTPLIIFDDFGMYPIDNATKLALLQILEDRYGKRAIVITSQLPVTKWYDYINEPTIADAIMDRLIHSAQRIELKGESMRKNKTKHQTV